MASTDLYWFNLYDPLVDPLVLAGSSLSLVATFLVLLTFAIYHKEQRTFRHALVLNLTIAEFINSLNATLSGSYFLVTKELTPGMLCSVNGWIGQVSVQAGDFSMFAIAVFTLLTITEKVYMPAVSNVKKAIICASVWIVPVTTGSIALGMGVMMPAGANWCWISSSRTDLRYALTHAWRFAIIFAIICIYGYVYYYTSRHFKSLGSPTSPTNHYSVASQARTDHNQPSAYEVTSSEPEVQSPTTIQINESKRLRDSSWLRLSVCSEKDLLQSPNTALTRLETAPPAYTEVECPSQLQQQPLRRPSLVNMFGTITRVETHKTPQTKRIEREVKRMLLMNAYPILYVLLSVPGLVNRLLQASGSPLSGRLLDALQASSAFIGFANAVTYGLNRHLRTRISGSFRSARSRKGEGTV
ncbi:hypothetical protein N0V93_001885 [Gnomoniopsis smithogilvyi]|uniref:Glucose receptor Git3-like N-terminal domain-containing protein n=1 Tax=Gnomoniopsis smithogilvyi TaxID=1191159 RepID=A0A9W9D1M8_9PEZI|nr:hypothetical protein N0V93_001885 [Gnomoniopsis smithogilvyi]